EALRPTPQRGVVREGVLRLRHAHGDVAHADLLEPRNVARRRTDVIDAVSAVDLARDRFDLRGQRLLERIERTEVRGIALQRVDHDVRQLETAGATLRMHVRKRDLHTQLAAAVQYDRDLLL